MEERIELAGGGRLYIREEGVRVRLEAVRADDGAGVYKVWIWGPAGQQLLGTPAPQGGQLRLERPLSRRSLEQAGCWPVTGGEFRMAIPFHRPPPGWTLEERPERLLPDPVLCASAGQCGPLLLCQVGEGFALAADYAPDRPFPLAPLFCLARLEILGDRRLLVFRFDSTGRPCLPPGRGDGAR